MDLLVSILGDWRTLMLVGVALIAFAWNAANRAKWDNAFAPSGSDDERIPERRWTYDAHDLEAFAAAASRVPLGEQTALQFYVSSILKASDVFFAIALAAVTAYAWYEIAISPMPYPWLNWIALPLGAMAILYGVADVAEDLKLAAMLTNPKMDRADAAAVNMLTRIKMVSLSLSVIGLVIFLVIAGVEILVGKVQRRAPAARA